jgi:hypothetical protein
MEQDPHWSVLGYFHHCLRAGSELTPQLVLKPLRQSPPSKYEALWWCSSLSIPTAILGGLLLGSSVFGPNSDSTGAITSLTVLLYAFCVLFAVNSAIHSYLIVRYADGDKVAMQVGVYYASNALGRLIGTLLSGVLYTYVGSTIVDGFGACLIASSIVSLISSGIDWFLQEDQESSIWTSFNLCLPCLVPRRRGLEGQGAVGSGGAENSKECVDKEHEAHSVV